MRNRYATFGLITGAAMFCCSGPALALDNPLIVHLKGATTLQQAAVATIFSSGPSVLVNLTGNGLPKNAAVTLNRGSCADPGAIAFALSRVSGGQSLTRLRHPLQVVAQRATSLVVHLAYGERSPVFACGELAE